MTDSKVKVYSPNEISIMWIEGVIMPTGFVSLQDYSALESANTRLRQQLEKCKEQRDENMKIAGTQELAHTYELELSELGKI